MSSVTVEPVKRLAGRLRVPGDKSISHRYAMLAAMAEGTSRLSGYAPGADCQSTLACLRALGVDVVADGPDALVITGRGLAGLRGTSSPLDAGNSGTTMRLLTGVVAGRPFVTTLTGDASLSRRPMRRVIEPLTEMGARIDATDGHSPLIVHGGRLRPLAYRPNVPSAQVKSAVLLAGFQAEGTTSVTEPVPTRDHTERALTAFGASVTGSGTTVSIVGGQRLSGQTLSIPGDFSSAAFWMVAAAALSGSCVELENVGLNPTRTALLDVLRRFGARVAVEVLGGDDAGEPRGNIRVEGTGPGSVVIEPGEVPALIDELPAIAALAAREGRVTVRGAAELRVKESDRITALVTGFRTLGIDAEELPDGFTIRGAGAPAGGTADAYTDHRIAMALAVAALSGRGPSTIDGADSVVISYPGFFEALGRLAA